MSEYRTEPSPPGAGGATSLPRGGRRAIHGSARALLVRGPRAAFRWTAYVLAVTAFAAAIPTPLYPLYEHQYGFSPGVLGLVFGAYTPGVLITLFLAAPQAERIGRRVLLAVGMLLTALGATVFALAPGALWLGVARFVAGLAVGATTSVATAAMNDLEPFRDEHHVARVAVAANFGAFAVGVLLTGFLAPLVVDPSRILYLFPIAASGIGLLAVWVVPETAPEAPAGRLPWIQRISVPAVARRPFWVAAGGIVACYSIYGLFAALVPSYVRDDLRIASPLAAGGAVALMFGLAALTQLATAQVRDRRALLLGLPILLAALAGLVTALPFRAWPLLLLVTAPLGIAVGLTFMGSVTLVDRVAPREQRGEMLAGFYSAGYLALAVPTLGVAVAAGEIGLANAGVSLGTILTIAVTILYVAIRRTPTPPGGGGRPRVSEPRPRST